MPCRRSSESTPVGGRVGAPRRRAPRAERGTVTAETAVLLPGLAALLAVVVSVLGSGLDLVKVTEASRAAARQLARGEPVQPVRAAALAACPAGSTVTVRRGEGEVVVTIVAPGRRALPGLPLPDVVAASTVADEWAGVTW